MVSSCVEALIAQTIREWLRFEKGLGREFDDPFAGYVGEMWQAIGMIPTHYCTDLWVSYIGRRHGWETVIRTGMRFTHYTAQPGRDYGRVGQDTQEYLRAIQAAT